MNITTKPTLTLIKELPAAIGPINTVAISPDRNWIASGGGSSIFDPKGDRTWSLQVYNSSWDNINLAKKNQWNSHGSGINSICFSIDNKLIAGSSSSYQKKPSLSQWNLEDACIESANGNDENISFTASSYDGEILFASTNTGIIKVFTNNIIKANKQWSISTKRKWSRTIYALIVSTDKKYLYSGGEENTIRLWHTQSGKEVRINFHTHDNAVRSLSLSPDDRILVSGSDQRIRIWDAHTGQLLHSFYGHADWVRGLAITPDSCFLISAGDEKIKFWDLETGKKLNTIIAHDRSIRSIALSRDGSTLVSGATDGIVKVWQVNKISEIEGL
jgi:COMPASS component SWD3